ncbi:hypothetical protein LJC48_07925 [Desulfovibrio sp. OttesenSCG-928-C06]|nr:hypothetical protein [Desulfovibrio sp. OttesenSCG-928-C06]
MSQFSTEVLKVAPYMDIELLLENSQESRIEGGLMDRLAESWADWMPHLHARRIAIGKDSYLAVWLDKEIEDKIDDIWEDAPSEAYMFNSLAQTMCMCAIYDLLPEVAEAGCAPAPRPTLDLKLALEAEGLRHEDEENPALALCRRYAVATYYPFRGGCDICDLSKECPKLQSGEGSYSVVLPGHE